MLSNANYTWPYLIITRFSILYVLVLDEVFPRHVSFLRIWDFCLTMTWKPRARRPSSSKPTRWEVNFNNLWCHILMLGRHVGRSVDTEWLYSKWNSTDADASGTFATAGWVIPFEISSDHLNLVWQNAWDNCGSPKKHLRPSRFSLWKCLISIPFLWLFPNPQHLSWPSIWILLIMSMSVAWLDTPTEGCSPRPSNNPSS